ncbi:hypothetical protein [Robinsoniella sp. KNHs210]|uniref:hypothetical protein n=1 Tax=Robinsoniella sp. KNHs210 TaxID=1469950 RepID=UPI0004824650|nr:hypothetical protein [Robinsoniella sp. KNHs210]
MDKEFSIEPKRTLENASSLEKMSKEIKVLAEQINDCRRGLKGSSRSYASVNQKLNELYQKVLREASQMNSFQEALESIVQLYTDCEERICDEGAKVGADKPQLSADAKGTDKRGFWKQLWDFIFGEDKDKAYTATTDEQQQAADQEMQKRINELLASDTYSEEAWKNATPEERQELLKNYMNEIEGVLGINVKDEVNFFYEKPKDGMITNGYYTDSKNRVSINSYIIDTYTPEKSYFLFTTITHEMRHAYQHAAVDHPTDYQVDKDTINSWKDNFKNYISSDDGYENYRNQPVESDAREFAGQK